MDEVLGKPTMISRVLLRLLFLSFTLNVGLVSRLIYEYDHERGSSSLHTTDAEEKQSYTEFCLGEEASKKTRESATMSTAAADHEAYVSESSPSLSTEAEEDGKEKVVNLDHGDPTMYEQFWQNMGDKSMVVISGWQSMSYFSDIGNICWFLEPEFAKEVRRLHQLVGNAVTRDHHIVVGTGSTQLFQAALYALSSSGAFEPVNVVSAAPYYSSYPSVTDYLKSGLYKWAGDAYSFKGDEPYIELVTSPNNPDGFMRQAVVNRNGGVVVHDLAYYWPHYTPITYLANHDIMLFTVSKCTGHAGTRIGWALVKDKEIAKKMTKFIELNTIGVSKDSQLRAAKILQVVSDSCEHLDSREDSKNFFRHASRLMAERWDRLRDAVRQSGLFSLPEFMPESCNYFGEANTPHPAFAWSKCEGGIEDCESFLRGYNIITRSGKHFGAEAKYVRISMLDREQTFNLFVKRLSNISL